MCETGKACFVALGSFEFDGSFAANLGAFAVVVGRMRGVTLSGEFSTLGWKSQLNFLEDPNQMKSSFIAIALTALFVTAGVAQEQASVSDAAAEAAQAVVTEVTPTTEAPIATVPMTEAPIVMSSPMVYSSPMPMSSSCGCSGVPMTMTSYVAPVTYQQPIVQQAQTMVGTGQIAQPITQSTIQPTQTFQSGFTTQPTYYGASYTQPYSPGCGCSGGQSVLATPISQPIVSQAAPITTQPITSTVSAPITQPTIAQPTTTLPVTQPVVQQTFPQTFSQPITGQTFQGSYTGTTTGNFFQPQSVYTNTCPNCCNNCNNNNNRFFNGRILRRR